MINTVRGPIAASELGFTLTHEHVLVDWIGAELTHPGRWDRDEVVAAMLPRLHALRARGVDTFVDCTPAYLGRDVEVLRRLSEASDLHILTNTGYYGAAGDRYIPRHAYTDSLDALADRWVGEFDQGIEGSGIRPGFIKIGVDPGHLSDIDRKLVRAAAHAHLRTGLLVACHTASTVAALEIVETLREEGVPADRYLCIHLDADPDVVAHEDVAASGAWVSYDAIGWKPVEFHLPLVPPMLAAHADRLLLSQDSGWWTVGEENGGDIRDYVFLTDVFLPALAEQGINHEAIRRVMVDNPARAFDVA